MNTIKKNTMFKPLLASMLLVFLVGCATYPLNMNKAEWEALTPAQQLQAREQQALLDQARAEQRTAEARAREQEIEKERIAWEVRRQEARYGDHLQCVISDVQLRNGDNWQRIHPFALDLLIGERADINLDEFRDDRRSRSHRAQAQFDGQTLSLCSSAHGLDCVRVLGNFSDYHRGFEQAFNQPNWLKGSARCQFVPKRR
ncbi:hypothetical protein [Thiomicrospira aerophila]|nr:hypothetical protein [Thiomicrospira aerophila]